jgi:hypothetical protein
MVFEEVRPDQCNMTRAPRPERPLSIQITVCLAGVLGPVALIGPHLLEKEARRGDQGEEWPRLSLPASDRETKEKATNRKN